MAATLFEKICSGEIPADIVYQDEQCVCFRDISPQAPEHLLLVPRKPIPRLSGAGEEDAALLGHMMLAACEFVPFSVLLCLWCAEDPAFGRRTDCTDPPPG